MNLSQLIQSANLLVVDDAPDNLRLLSRLLTQQGYKVRRLINGQLALDAAQLEPPDLILLDIMMPTMSGYEVCKRLKADDRTCQIPVIFLSALDEELDKVQAFQVGGVDYITKPFLAMEVLARVELHLTLSHIKQQLQAKNLQLNQQVAQRLAAETALQSLIDQQATLASAEPTSTPVSAVTADYLVNPHQSQLLTPIARDCRLALSQIAVATQRLQQSPVSEPHSQDWQTIADGISQIEHLLRQIDHGLQVPLSPTDLKNDRS